MTKRILHRKIAELDLDDTTLDELLSTLQSIKDKHPTEDIKVEYISVCQYSGSTSMWIYFNSLETDDEYAERLAYEAEALETKERKELGRLASAKKLNEKSRLRLIELLTKYNPTGE